MSQPFEEIIYEIDYDYSGEEGKGDFFFFFVREMVLVEVSINKSSIYFML